MFVGLGRSVGGISITSESSNIGMFLEKIFKVENMVTKLQSIPLLVLLIMGCSQDPMHVIGSDPQSGPGGVTLGMTRQEVIQTMLIEVQKLQMSGRVTNPYETRFIKNVDGGLLEVMYYYTGMKKGDDLVTEDELVPVILKDDSVVGWGRETLEEMVGNRPAP